MSEFDFNVYAVCVGLSVVLMCLFVLINYPYYKITYGSQSIHIVTRAIFLNILAIAVGWGPVVYFWPEAALTVILPAGCVIGAFACVGSRFVYTEIVPEALVKAIVENIEKKVANKDD
jgi:hypothetical protein